MIKAIIFDCWKTLFFTDLDPHPFARFAKLIGQDMKNYEYVKKFEKHFMLEKHLDHRTPTLSLLTELKIKPNESLLDELIKVLEVSTRVVSPYPDTLEVLPKLKTKYKLGLITNTEYLGYQKLKEKFHIDNLFDFVIPSFEVGLSKPDPKIFEMMLKELRVKAEEAVMVGDSLQDDYRAARLNGINAILLDRQDKHPGEKIRIKSLSDIDQLVNRGIKI